MQDVLLIITGITLLISTVFVHELAHCAVAKVLGFRINSVIYSKFVLAIDIDMDNANGVEKAAIYIAGPLSDLLFTAIALYINPLLAIIPATMFIFNASPIKKGEIKTDGYNLFTEVM